MQMMQDSTEHIEATGTFASGPWLAGLQSQHLNHAHLCIPPPCESNESCSMPILQQRQHMRVKSTASSLAWITPRRLRQRPFGPGVACAPLTRHSTSTTHK